MPKAEERIKTLNPDPEKSGTRISRAKYEAVRRAILKVVPAAGDGLPFKELPSRVRNELPKRDLATLGSVSWYTTTVKLDLEARGELKRVPGARPQRLLKA